MKRLALIITSLFITVALPAQEPGNNLRKTVTELRRSFPDLVVWGYERSGIQDYKSPEANILFETKKGIVITEFTTFEGDNKFLKDLFNALVDSFSVKAKHYLWCNDRNSISFFYSYFSVYISYHPYESVSITYELNRNLWP